MVNQISTVKGKVREPFTQGVVGSSFIGQPVQGREAGWDVGIMGACSITECYWMATQRISNRGRTPVGMTANVAGRQLSDGYVPPFRARPA